MEFIDLYKEKEISVSDDVKPWNLFDGSPRSPEDVAAHRLEICKGCDFFRPMPFTEDGVRLRTIFFYAKMTICALFSPKSSIFLCQCTNAHTN